MVLWFCVELVVVNGETECTVEFVAEKCSKWNLFLEDKNVHEANRKISLAGMYLLSIDIIEASSGQAITFGGDVSKEEDVESMIKVVSENSSYSD
ncbi:hypothetical protein Syun_009176 [Stephania yunnanensis]|uniref:Uncharacterized protein n=1 Tax=Stephania yunnanensis TaxID=152371 RepID=A0AAP0KE59_9MAGN